MTIPEIPKVIELLQTILVTNLDTTVNHGDVIRADQQVTIERVVSVEIMSPDGGVMQKIPLPESTLDATLEIVRKLPDGNYRFQLQEPGEERQRLLLEFEVRQGKIVDRDDDSFRPPSATKRQKMIVPAESNEQIDPPVEAESAEFSRPTNSNPPIEFDLTANQEVSSEGGVDAQLSDLSRGRFSLVAKRAWRHADRVVEQMAGQFENQANRDTTILLSVTNDDHSIEDHNNLTEQAAASVGAAVLLSQFGASEVLDSRNTRSTTLGRAARLIRKYFRPMNDSRSVTK